MSLSLHVGPTSCYHHGLFTNGWERGHVTCRNWLAIERQESFQKFASLQEELLLRPVGTLQDFAWLDMGKNDSSSIK